LTVDGDDFHHLALFFLQSEQSDRAQHPNKSESGSDNKNYFMSVRLLSFELREPYTNTRSVSNMADQIDESHTGQQRAMDDQRETSVTASPIVQQHGETHTIQITAPPDNDPHGYYREGMSAAWFPD